MLDGYTFYAHKKAVKSIIWSCTGSQSCRARLKLQRAVNVHDRVIIDAKLDHIVILLAKSRYSGKHLVMYNDYTYYCKKQCKKTKFFHWYCSTHNYRGCNAKLKLDEKFGIIGIEDKHTHPPAKYCIYEGQYVKLSDQ
ncbi:Uncharacterized protein OBRU01_09541 [Operophtera brumata]|uniref:FLYWCH-type domain-containing protein n=1 Tax=Operophtera brumata TaxID=104452 RepID=A0A0L7LG56_OPEBR|nr:Uncharacterized protein OBRU01_09541 [Operophtera brumata]